MSRPKIPAAANRARAQSASADRSADLAPVGVAKGRLRKCGPIVLIALRVNR